MTELSYEDVYLYQRDIDTLKEGQWLGDKVLSFAVRYLYNTVLTDEMKEKIEVLDAAFCQLLKLVSPTEIQVLCENLSLDRKDHVLFILNDENDPDRSGGTHWSLLIYSRGANHLKLYDSLPNPSTSAALMLSQKMVKILNLPKADVLIEPCCKQQNSSDCGLYVIAFVQKFLENTVKHLECSRLNIDQSYRSRKFWIDLIENLASHDA
ncbi:hypothetical protein AB6A40_002388 [Gnathostoma spinigerum]|uniref:Ubiquitin-like protease family profile domain-containing protein n=1 Tax=Gnathostoma spinigerum TaxID=75299 RepID=A0ABD6EE94_9BILA